MRISLVLLAALGRQCVTDRCALEILLSGGVHPTNHHCGLPV